MHAQTLISSPSAATLLEIIRIQTEIAKAGLDLADVMALVARRAQFLTGAAGAVVELAEGEQMVYRAACGIAEPQLGLRLQQRGSLSGLCVEQGKILHCTDSETDPRVDREACRKVGLRSMILVPLHHLDVTVGALKVLSPLPCAFNDGDIEVLGLMSELIAAAMFHAAKFETNELYFRATHDALTGIANRALFFDRLRQSLAHAERHSERVGILFLDMDDLKPINDRYGHRAGDAAIKELAQRIAGECRETDTVARVGGDEFGVILSHVASRSGVESKRDRLAECIDFPLQFEQHQLSLRASIGLAVFPDDGRKIDFLVDKADRAMYEVKRRRKSIGC
ncbi:sensor domain-containing diguanylate cyclase [Janthinobacterium agaricidamnosum]|uniref:Diguanylate cyclase domain protein n=1 Tax=Janthinobacterium agaricidamnosum NBRC 102515 = DSM 9628 TaxID=1349767 RepID=W0V0W5_9BURK|nr:sensor domain-containing diguanylate cyclase [Janthinobacterium agaricidamnosum]CDG80983.1 diguanylate cyclase domain protein [Janthinobacterium agaricidamnosum NBRC 102515 = DSM 9628]